jgi:hypothetical protein
LRLPSLRVSGIGLAGIAVPVQNGAATDQQA